MIPHNLRLDNLDEGIRNLVVNLNRIPGIGTCTTCEGHIWRSTPGWPTKDGWIYINKPKDAAPGLVPRIKGFIEAHSHFTFREPKPTDTFPDLYMISALFESHDCGDLFNHLTKSQQRNYYRRAKTRLEHNLRGWADLDGVVTQYLVENFGENYIDIPFRESEQQRVWRIDPCGRVG